MPGIRVKEGESFESALRRFKKKCEKAGLMADLRRHQHFEKPSERRKRKVNAARRKAMARRQQENY
uniref:Small ribosomal subunit protein bS21 n=1 Tax=Eiseniibacteriota bacterium TaxID=2212470 RepID=A0A832MJM8_UNCEI